MHVVQLQLRQFRNYEILDLTCSPSTNVFVGQNAQGKTNILESILMLAVAKSHRTNKDQEMIRWEQEAASVCGDIFREQRHYKLELHLLKKGKKVSVNGLEKRKLSEFVGYLNTVMFAPEDLTLVKGSPQVRRRFMDLEIGQMSPRYLHNLTQYQKVLQQRNNVLKQGAHEAAKWQAMLPVWDAQLLEYGSKIISKRCDFLRKLQVYANEIHRRISGGKETLTLTYVSSFPLPLEEWEEAGAVSMETFGHTIQERYQKAMEQRIAQDIQKGSTSVGPHRDDIQICINNKPVDRYGSQGQQRTAALAMKLAEIDLIRDEVGEYPVLLLDDVLSELDEQRQLQLVQSMGEKVQTFITTTSTHGLEDFLKKNSEVFAVDSGIITHEGQV
jgi:DNA replication and repair protein RecF